MVRQLASQTTELLGIRVALKSLIRQFIECGVPRVVPKIIRWIPHDTKAFTQGLAYYRGYLYESTGLVGESSLRKIDPKDGRILSLTSLDGHFGEGIAAMDGCMYQLTWQSRRAVVYVLPDVRHLAEIPYDAEGWGMTADPDNLITSDGSSILKVRTQDLHVIRRLRVSSHGMPIWNINDIAWANGRIFANLFNTSEILEIADDTGHLTRIIDCSSLGTLEQPKDKAHVLNGVAFNADTGTFFVTGKCWSRLFELAIPLRPYV